ncbi:hypothetical protein PIB30_113257, partial [Stylosanthes scabra]|nr:hypothetical protein [Stylosanthes scabra]
MMRTWRTPSTALCVDRGPDRTRPIRYNQNTLLLDHMLSQIAQEERPRLGGFGLHKGKGSRKYVVVAILHNGHQKHSAVSPIQ